VVALGVAYCVWGELLTPIGILGASMVISGILWSANRTTQPHPDEIHP
jgi:drug/metabolite transporter (DMT)-like permease